MFRFIQKVRQNRTGWSASRLRPPGMRLRRLIPHAAAVLLAVSVASTMLWAANTTVAGIVAGQLSVDSIGGANYDLPLEVAPGVNDLTPTLSLSYNSRIRTNGILGVGWTLNGLSTIYRCSKSQQLDGTVAPLENNNADRLCVDGARLIASTGASDSQYLEHWRALSYLRRVLGTLYSCKRELHSRSGQFYREDPGRQYSDLRRGRHRRNLWSRSLAPDSDQRSQ